MSDQLRHHLIVDLLKSRAFLSVSELTERAGVSAATVRRDIDKLSEAGLAQKVHGGVAAIGGIATSPAMPFAGNGGPSKAAIARAAAGLVRDGTSIVIHGGSTCFRFGQEIANRNLRVFTTYMPLAAWLAEQGTCQLRVGGGDLHRDLGVLYDAALPAARFYAAQVFIGARAITAQGLVPAHPLLVPLIEGMGPASELVVLAESTKFAPARGTPALPLSRIARVITDDALAASDARMLADHGIETILAEKGTP